MAPETPVPLADLLPIHAHCIWRRPTGEAFAPPMTHDGSRFENAQQRFQCMHVTRPTLRKERL